MGKFRVTPHSFLRQARLSWMEAGATPQRRVMASPAPLVCPLAPAPFRARRPPSAVVPVLLHQLERPSQLHFDACWDVLTFCEGFLAGVPEDLGNVRAERSRAPHWSPLPPPGAAHHLTPSAGPVSPARAYPLPRTPIPQLQFDVASTRTGKSRALFALTGLVAGRRKKDVGVVEGGGDGGHPALVPAVRNKGHDVRDQDTSRRTPDTPPRDCERNPHPPPSS